MRDQGKDWTGNSVYLWAVVNAVYMALLGPQGFRELGELILQRSHYAAQRLAAIPGVRVAFPSGFFKELVVSFEGADGARGQRGPARAPHLRRQGSLGGLPGARAERPLLRDRAAHEGRHRPARRARSWRSWHDEAPRLPRPRLGRARHHGDGPSRPARARLPAGRARGAGGRRRRGGPGPGRHAACEAASAARAVGARGAAPLPAPLAGDAGHDGDQPLRHLHDEVQPAGSARRSPAATSPTCTRTRTRRPSRACSRSSTGST